jgi:hypothetical protein
MLNENGSPYQTTTDGQTRKIRMGGAVASRKGGRVRGSIRELELVAADLRREGDNSRADEVDVEIMAMLDRKISRKIIKRSRKEQKLIHMGSI